MLQSPLMCRASSLFATCFSEVNTLAQLRMSELPLFAWTAASPSCIRLTDIISSLRVVRSVRGPFGIPAPHHHQTHDCPANLLLPLIILTQPGLRRRQR